MSKTNSALISAFEQHAAIGAAVPTGVTALQEFQQLKLGNIVLLMLPDNRTEALEVMRYCRKHQIWVLVAEFIYRGKEHLRWHCPSLSQADLEAIFAAGGEYFLGRYTIGESGGLLYWPREYLLNPNKAIFPALPPARSNGEAQQIYLDWLRNYLKIERETVANTRFFDIDSSIVFSYHAAAGIDGLCLEMLPGDPVLTLAAIRGTARATGKIWGVHIAIKYYNGVAITPMWLKRWKFSLWLSWLSGAHFIFPESGHYVYQNFDQGPFGFDSPETTAIRAELRKLAQFSRLHRRPESGPEVPMGIIHGNGDGHPGIWNPYAWGQVDNGDKWESSDAEKGWFLLRQLRRKVDCFRQEYNFDVDSSGNPAAGQYDIVPWYSSNFNKYPVLVLLGPNIMNEELYQRLIDYVKQGGHLLLSLSHCVLDAPRGEIAPLFQNGDLTELCGVRITGRKPTLVHGIQMIHDSWKKSCRLPRLKLKSDPLFLGRHTPAEVDIVDPQVIVLAGFTVAREENSLESFEKHPVLIEHRLGAGTVWLVTDFEAPGAVGMQVMYENLLRILARSCSCSEEQVLAADTMRWARYRDERGEFRYFLNTDFDLSSQVRIIGLNGQAAQFELPAAGWNWAFQTGNLLIMPENPLCNVENVENNAITLSTPAQTLTVWNLGAAAENCSINGKTRLIPPGEPVAMSVGTCFIRPKEAEIYADSWLQEPPIHPENTELNY